MDTMLVNNIVDNIFATFSLFRKKIFSTDNGRFVIKPSTSQFAIMMILLKSGPLSISEIGKKLSISKPNMSPLVNNLIQEGIIKKTGDKSDKRVLNIELTLKGKNLLSKTKKKIRKNIKLKLMALKKQDIKQLANSLNNIRDIVSKLD